MIFFKYDLILFRYSSFISVSITFILKTIFTPKFTYPYLFIKIFFFLANNINQNHGIIKKCFCLFHLKSKFSASLSRSNYQSIVNLKVEVQSTKSFHGYIYTVKMVIKIKLKGFNGRSRQNLLVQCQHCQQDIPLRPFNLILITILTV